MLLERNGCSPIGGNCYIATGVVILQGAVVGDAAAARQSVKIPIPARMTQSIQYSYTDIVMRGGKHLCKSSQPS